MAKTATAKSKVQAAIEDLRQEETRLNRALDSVNDDLKQLDRAHRTRAEIAAALDALTKKHAEKFRSSLDHPLRNKNLNRLELIHVPSPLTGAYDTVTDFCYFLIANVPGLREKILDFAPANGITAEAEAEQRARLISRKLGVEAELEAIYEELESIGCVPSRRLDLSPEVLLKFKSPKDWDREKFRQLNLQFRDMGAAINDQVSYGRNLAFDIQKERSLLESMKSSGGETKNQSAKVAALEKEQTDLQARIREQAALRDDAGQVVNRCREFLKKQGVQIDE